MPEAVLLALLTLVGGLLSALGGAFVGRRTRRLQEVGLAMGNATVALSLYERALLAAQKCEERAERDALLARDREDGLHKRIDMLNAEMDRIKGRLHGIATAAEHDPDALPLGPSNA